MKKRLRVYFTIVVFAALAGCEMTLPGAPSDLATGIVVYEHANYLGQSTHITKDIKDLKDVDRGPCRTEDASNWNDCISSVRVAPGAGATLYRDPNFKGESLEISFDIPQSAARKGIVPARWIERLHHVNPTTLTRG